MLRWVIALLAATAFVWGLSRVIDALTCGQLCTSDQILLGVVGVSLAGLSFAYLIFLFTRIQADM